MGLYFINSFNMRSGPPALPFFLTFFAILQSSSLVIGLLKGRSVNGSWTCSWLLLSMGLSVTFRFLKCSMKFSSVILPVLLSFLLALLMMLQYSLGSLLLWLLNFVCSSLLPFSSSFQRASVGFVLFVVHCGLPFLKWFLSWKSSLRFLAHSVSNQGLYTWRLFLSCVTCIFFLLIVRLQVYDLPNNNCIRFIDHTLVYITSVYI